MKISAILAVAVAALEGVNAHPTISHAKFHKLRLRDLLKKKDLDLSGVDWNTALAGKDWSKVNYDTPGGTQPPANTGSGSSAPPTEDKSVAKAAAGSTSGGSSGQSQTSSSQSAPGGSGKCLNVKALLSKRATAQQDGYVGNTQGNITPEPNCQSSGHYSVTFVNKRGSTKSYDIWNKIGTDGKQSGMMSKPAQSFKLEDGQSATFTFGPNSQIGFSEDMGRAAGNGGVPNGPVGEVNFNDHNFGGGSDGGSWYDVSMVTVNDIKKAGGSPMNVPITLTADNWDPSTNTNCVYTDSSQNSPVNPGKSGKCACGPRDASDLHITATFG